MERLGKITKHTNSLIQSSENVHSLIPFHTGIYITETVLFVAGDEVGYY